MSAELLLSTRTYLVLNPCIISMITSGSSCGFTPSASSSEKTISMASLFLCFNNVVVWMLLTCLCYDFLRDLKYPPTVGPPLIILISPKATIGRSCCFCSSLGLSSDLTRWLCLYRLGVSFFTNFCNFPSGSILLSALLSLYTHLCDVHDLSGNDSTSYCERWVKSSMALAIERMVVLNLHQDLVNRHYQGVKFVVLLALSFLGLTLSWLDK